VLAIKEMLEWLAARHQDEALARMARAAEEAVASTLSEGRCLSADLAAPGKAARCSEVGTHLAERAALAFA